VVKKVKKTKTKIKKFNCCPKLGSPVIVPRRKEVLEIFEDLKPEIVNHFHSVDELMQLFGGFIGKRFNVDVKHAEATQVDQNDIELQGFYDGGLDEVGDVPIEIYLVTNPMQDVMIIDQETFESITRKISDTLSHEVIHMQQYRARDFLEVDRIVYVDEEDEEEENRYYLSNPDEINAYAYNIANELLDRHDNLAIIKIKLEKLKEIKIEDSVNLWAYVQAFSKDSNHPVLKRLVKKVYKSLNNLSK
jgi:hypothetical protein